ncbi:MAG: hypothetical protein ACXWU5_08875 [Rhodoplanes sp.]
MNAITTKDVLRPGRTGLAGRVTALAMEYLPLGFRLLRAVRPIVRFGDTVVVTRYDDVREVFLDDRSFRVPYAEKLDVIMGGQPFFLSMDDTPEYRRDTEAMRKVVRPGDLPSLAARTEQVAETIVGQANGRLEVVDALVRRTTFEVLGAYFGIPDPPGADLRVWATRLFEFQFADPGNDPALRSEVDTIAPALRDHIQGLIDARRQSGNFGDDVLGRCLDMQARGEEGFQRRPDSHVVDGFHRRRTAAAANGGSAGPRTIAAPSGGARGSAAGSARQRRRVARGACLRGHALRSARPGLAPHRHADEHRRPGNAPRRRGEGGGHRLRRVQFGDDGRAAIADPQLFNPRRLPHEYIHFGYGHHTCFGIHMNKVMLPLMLKPLLKRPNLRRAPGPAGRLSKRGAFADQLHVEFD